MKVLPLPHSDATSLTSGAWTNIPSQTDIPGSGGLDVLTDPSPNGTPRFHRITTREDYSVQWLTPSPNGTPRFHRIGVRVP